MNADVAILEVRSAAGGDEAKIWADDILKMYLKYSQNQNWESTLIGKGVIRIKGDQVYNKLKNETGVHRVQRIPATERHGRLHTSTATVAVLPEIADSDIQINPQDLEWQFYRASTQGGQNVQKVSSAVRLIHKPTNTVVTCEQERFQEKNRELALQLLKAKLWEKEEAKKENTVAGYRSPIGRGMRSEKIRTYNYPQNRITDHRLNKKFYDLENILNGSLEKILKSF